MIKTSIAYPRMFFIGLHSSNFIVDLSRLSSVEILRCNDGEAMKHHGETMRVSTYGEDRNLTTRHTSKFTQEENDNEKWYLYEYVTRTQCK